MTDRDSVNRQTMKVFEAQDRYYREKADPRSTEPYVDQLQRDYHESLRVLFVLRGER